MSYRSLNQFTIKPTWPSSWGTSNAKLVIILDRDVVAADATQFQGAQNHGEGVSLDSIGHYFSSTITVTDGVASAGPIANLPTTDTSAPLHTARYYVYIYVGNEYRDTLTRQGFHLHESVNGELSTFSWQQWVVAQQFKQGSSQLPMIGDRATLQAMVDAANLAGGVATTSALGRVYADVEPDDAARPTAVMTNSPLLLMGGHVVTPQQKGAVTSGAVLITQDDIDENTQWIGTYAVGDSFDAVGAQEAIYAAFATNSTPGNIVWNAEAGTTYLDKPLFFPEGRYYINRQLEIVANGFDIYGAGKRATFIDWYGPDDEAMIYCDAVAYGTFSKMTLGAQSFTTEALLELDWTGAHSGILVNNNFSLYDMQIDCLSTVDGTRTNYGVRISKSGSSSQGDTINLLNTSFTSAKKAGLAIGFVNAQNALGINLYGGGFIDCVTDGISITGGQVYIRGTFFGNQNTSESQTLNTQITNGGADVHVYSGAGASGLSSMRDVRSESDVLSIGVAHLDHCALVCASVELWAANSSYQPGQLIKGTAGVGEKGEAGRTFMMVASTAGTDFITPAATGSTSVINDPTASYTVNEWAGYGLTMRYPNGFLATRVIASNTATSITLASPLPFAYIANGQVCFPGELYPCSQYRIGGLSDSTEPDWDTVPAGFNGASGGLGANITQGDTTLTAAYMGGARSVGDYVMVAGAGADGGPLISRVASVNSAVSVELDDAAGTTVTGAQFYVGEAITDGQLMWIDIDFNAVTNPSTMKAVYLNAGRVVGANNATIYGCRFARPDWLRPSEFQVGSAGDNNYPSFIFNNTVGAGDINETTIPYNLFYGTSAGLQQYAPANMAAGMFSFDSGEGSEILGAVGIGRGDGIRAIDANAVTRNVLAFLGILGRKTPTGTNQAGAATQIQGGLSTGNGAPGAIEFWLGAAGSSGSSVNAGAKSMSLDTAGLHLPVLAFANVGTPANGTLVYVSDGTAGSPLTGGGTGCLAIRANGAWIGLS